MSLDERASELAKHEIGWWKAHHRGNRDDLIENMARLYEKQYDMPYEEARRVVSMRVEAAREHDIAEKFEDECNQPKADAHWQKAEELLKSHFVFLLQYQQKEVS